MIKGLSICIIFRNEGANIVRSLNAVLVSLLKYRLTSDSPVELIFINNCSDLNCEFYIEQFCQANDLTYKVMSTNSNNMGLARNKALMSASYETLIFLDADCCPQDNWLLNYSNWFGQLNNHRFGAVGGENIPPRSDQNIFYSCCQLLKKNPLLYLGSTQLLPTSQLKKVSRMPTCNVLYKTEVLKTVGGFDEAFNKVGEDLELNARLISHGYEIYMAPDLEVEHYDKTDFRIWFKKVLRYGSIQPQVISMHPRHIGVLRWLPLFAVFALATAILLYPKIVLFTLLGLALFVPTVTCALNRQWPILLPWLGFLNGTVLFYLCGYAIGVGKTIKKSLNTIP